MRLLRPVTDPRFVLDPARQGRELAFFLRWLTPVVLGFAIVELIGCRVRRLGGRADRSRDGDLCDLVPIRGSTVAGPRFGG